MTTIRSLITIIAISLVFVGCNKGLVYSHYSPVSLAGWDKDSAVVFDFAITDTSKTYDLILHIRHTERYSYQNMWLFVTTEPQPADTIEFYLADERGRWLGNGQGSLFDMPVFYEENKHFADTGSYVISVQHGMRNEQLVGISDIGLEIVQHGEE